MTAFIDRRTTGFRRLVVAAAIAGALLIALGSARAATVTVAAVNFEFQPPSRSVRVGDVVRWTFAGDPHTVTSGTPGAPDGRFDSGVEDPGGSFQVTFDQAGTFRYFCQIHSEQMTGTIVVTAGPAATPRPTAKPTPKPTSRPTATPRQTSPPTAAPTEPPTAAPTQPPSPSPSSTVATAPPTPAPAASAPAASAPTASPAPSTPGPSQTPVDGVSAGSLDPAIVVVGLVGLGLLAAGAIAITRRPRNS